MSNPGSGGPEWPRDPAGQNPPSGGQPPYGQQPPGQPQFQPPPPTTQMPAVPPAYGQPGPPGYGAVTPPPYGQPGGYGPQPPVPPGYGTPYGPQPPRPGRSMAPIIAAIVVLLLVGGGVTTFFLTRDSKSKPKADPTTSVSGGAKTSPGFPSSANSPSSANPPSSASNPSSASSGSVSEADARAVVEKYLDDVNTQNRSDAQTLICTVLVDTWKQKIDKPGGDFTVTVTKTTYQGAKPNSADGLDLKYSLNVKDVKSDKTGVSPVTFKIIDEDGDLKICGES